MEIKVNGTLHAVDVEPNMPLLWVLRDELGITGPKYGCGIAQCGGCTVHIDGVPIRSCQMPAAAVEGEVTTIDHPDPPPPVKAVQKAWREHQVAQCGYCQGGQMMQAAFFIQSNPSPTKEQVDSAMSANLCRCGTYPRIRKAVQSAAKILHGEASES